MVLPGATAGEERALAFVAEWPWELETRRTAQPAQPQAQALEQVRPPNRKTAPCAFDSPFVCPDAFGQGGSGCRGAGCRDGAVDPTLPPLSARKLPPPLAAPFRQCAPRVFEPPISLFLLVVVDLFRLSCAAPAFDGAVGTPNARLWRQVRGLCWRFVVAQAPTPRPRPAAPHVFPVIAPARLGRASAARLGRASAAGSGARAELTGVLASAYALASDAAVPGAAAAGAAAAGVAARPGGVAGPGAERPGAQQQRVAVLCAVAPGAALGQGAEMPLSSVLRVLCSKRQKHGKRGQ